MSDKTVEVSVTEETANSRLDRALVELLAPGREVSRSLVAEWIAGGRVCLNGEVCRKPAAKVKTGDRLVLSEPPPRELRLEAQSDIPFGILFEDEDLIVINKPPGLAVHPGAGQHRDTLVNALLSHLGPSLQQIGDALRPGLVHRLDKDTSGVMVVAKSDLGFRELRSQFKPPRRIRRTYLCLAESLPRKMSGSVLDPGGRSGVIELPIGRHPKTRVKMAVVAEGGKAARTFWALRETFARAALLEARLDTGRTHQIRVHFAHCGAPLLGDTVYGKVSSSLPPLLRAAIKRFGRQALHSARLELIHPRSGEELRFECPLPGDFRALIGAFTEPSP